MTRRPVDGEWTWLPGVFAAITDERGRLLCVKHSYGDKRWSLPGGGIEDGETVMEALKREVREETGFEVEPDKLIGSYSRPEAGRQSLLIRCRIVGGSFMQSSEEIDEVAFFERNEFPNNFGPSGRAYIRDTYSGELGFVRSYNSETNEYE